MKFEGRVWRHVPQGAHPLDFHYLIHAAGRWNRRGLYGCLYTALTPRGAAAEHRKHARRRGLSRPRDLVALDVEVDATFDVAAWAEVETGRRTRHPDEDRWLWPPPDVPLTAFRGDEADDLEACRRLADWARTHGYLALLAPSAAVDDEQVLAVYPENRPARIDIRDADLRHPLNYGEDAFIDDAGDVRGLPAEGEAG